MSFDSGEFHFRTFLACSVATFRGNHLCRGRIFDSSGLLDPGMKTAVSSPSPSVRYGGAMARFAATENGGTRSGHGARGRVVARGTSRGVVFAVRRVVFGPGGSSRVARRVGVRVASRAPRDHDDRDRIWNVSGVDESRDARARRRERFRVDARAQRRTRLGGRAPRASARPTRPAFARWTPRIAPTSSVGNATSSPRRDDARREVRRASDAARTDRDDALARAAHAETFAASSLARRRDAETRATTLAESNARLARADHRRVHHVAARFARANLLARRARAFLEWHRAALRRRADDAAANAARTAAARRASSPRAIRRRGARPRRTRAPRARLDAALVLARLAARRAFRDGFARETVVTWYAWTTARRARRVAAAKRRDELRSAARRHVADVYARDARRKTPRASSGRVARRARVERESRDARDAREAREAARAAAGVVRAGRARADAHRRLAILPRRATRRGAAPPTRGSRATRTPSRDSRAEATRRASPRDVRRVARRRRGAATRVRGGDSRAGRFSRGESVRVVARFRGGRRPREDVARNASRGTRSFAGFSRANRAPSRSRAARKSLARRDARSANDARRGWREARRARGWRRRLERARDDFRRLSACARGAVSRARRRRRRRDASRRETRGESSSRNEERWTRGAPPSRRGDGARRTPRRRPGETSRDASSRDGGWWPPRPRARCRDRETASRSSRSPATIAGRRGRRIVVDPRGIGSPARSRRSRRWRPRVGSDARSGWNSGRPRSRRG